MNEPYSSEQLLRAQEAILEGLLTGLVVAVVLMLAAAILLIILCCRQLKSESKKRDAEFRAACDACRRSSRRASAEGEAESSGDVDAVHRRASSGKDSSVEGEGFLLPAIALLRRHLRFDHSRAQRPTVAHVTLSGQTRRL